MSDITTENRKLKFVSYTVSFCEVPNEISLVINISGCQHHCHGCHSKYLWEYKGYDLYETFENLESYYSKLISCVCFMGGDYNIPELIELCAKAHNDGYKTCIYSGYEQESEKGIELKRHLGIEIDYLKLGPYVEQCGPLNSTTTNQVFYSANGDITAEFQRKKTELV